MKRCLAVVLAVLIPACAHDEDNIVKVLPVSIADADYGNGHPLVRNAAQNAALEQAHVSAVNAWRGSVGLPAFAVSDSLSAVARAYSEHMTLEPFFSHTAPEGGKLSDRIILACGVPMIYAAENLMMTSDGSAASVLAGFLASPGHKANLSDTTANTLGVGIWFSGSMYYVTYEMVWR